MRESVRPQLQLAHTAMAAERAIAVHWCCRPGRRRTSNVHLRALFLCVAGLALARVAGGDAATPPSAADPAVGPAAPKTFHVIWYAGGEMRAKSLSSDEACRRFTRGLGEGAPWPQHFLYLTCSLRSICTWLSLRSLPELRSDHRLNVHLC